MHIRLSLGMILARPDNLPRNKCRCSFRALSFLVLLVRLEPCAQARFSLQNLTISEGSLDSVNSNDRALADQRGIFSCCHQFVSTCQDLLFWSTDGNNQTEDQVSDFAVNQGCTLILCYWTELKELVGTFACAAFTFLIVFIYSFFHCASERVHEVLKTKQNLPLADPSA